MADDVAQPTIYAVIASLYEGGHHRLDQNLLFVFSLSLGKLLKASHYGSKSPQVPKYHQLKVPHCLDTIA